MTGPRYTRDMSQYENPIPAGDDPSNYTEPELVEFMRKLRTDRRDKGVTIPRFVRAINKAGYHITASAYKECEQYPGKGIEHIQEWMLVYAYKVLNATRVQGSVQGKHTAHAMTVIGDTRVLRGFAYHDMSEKLSARGITITEAEYRTSEQGITKYVSYEVIAECASILGIAPGELFL